MALTFVSLILLGWMAFLCTLSARSELRRVFSSICSGTKRVTRTWADIRAEWKRGSVKDSSPTPASVTSAPSSVTGGQPQAGEFRLGAISTGYLCSRCERYEIQIHRVISVEQTDTNELTIKHICFCTEKAGVPLKGRYVLVPDLVYRLFRNRVVRLPYYGTPGLRSIRGDHPALVEIREELNEINTLDDLFPPG